MSTSSISKFRPIALRKHARDIHLHPILKGYKTSIKRGSYKFPLARKTKIIILKKQWKDMSDCLSHKHYYPLSLFFLTTLCLVAQVMIWQRLLAIS